MIQAAEDLHPTTWRMLRALRAGVPISRNRHFALFQDAHVRRAVELHRFLRSVADDVRRYADHLTVSASRPQEGERGAHALRLDFERLHGRRTAYLTDFELTLLAEDSPQVAQLLRARISAARSPAAVPKAASPTDPASGGDS